MPNFKSASVSETKAFAERFDMIYNKEDNSIEALSKFAVWESMRDDDNGTKYLKYKFSYIEGNFIASNIELTSFYNFPQIISGDLSLGFFSEPTFEYFPKCVFGNISFGDTPLSTFNKRRPLENGLRGLDKYLHECDGFIQIPRQVRCNLLAALKINNLIGIRSNTAFSDNDRTLIQAIKIINEHLAKGRTFSTREPLECQDRLIEAGLGSYAKF